MTELEPYPERQARDHVRSVAEAAIAGAPTATWLAGFGAELLTNYLPSSLEKRRDRWFRVLDERFRDLEDAVADDEAFHSRVLEATQAALGTHFDEKLLLLANALESCAETSAEGGDTFMDKRLLEWVDELEPLHFQILAAIYDDLGWGGNVPWSTVLSRMEISDDDVWFEALEDLIRRRLVGSTGYNHLVAVKDSPDELIWVEKRGAQLVRFVRMMTDEPSEGVDAEDSPPPA